jgi:hypothetical protein
MAGITPGKAKAGGATSVNRKDTPTKVKTPNSRKKRKVADDAEDIAASTDEQTPSKTPTSRAKTAFGIHKSTAQPVVKEGMHPVPSHLVLSPSTAASDPTHPTSDPSVVPHSPKTVVGDPFPTLATRSPERTTLFRIMGHYMILSWHSFKSLPQRRHSASLLSFAIFAVTSTVSLVTMLQTIKIYMRQTTITAMLSTLLLLSMATTTPAWTARMAMPTSPTAATDSSPPTLPPTAFRPVSLHFGNFPALLSWVNKDINNGDDDRTANMSNPFISRQRYARQASQVASQSMTDWLGDEHQEDIEFGDEGSLEDNGDSQFEDTDEVWVVKFWRWQHKARIEMSYNDRILLHSAGIWVF